MAASEGTPNSSLTAFHMFHTCSASLSRSPIGGALVVVVTDG